MYVINDYGLVRIVREGDPFTKAYDIVVEFRETAESDWQFYHGFNTLSDDYAYTNAREAAGRCIKKLAAEKANLFAKETK